MPVTWCIQCATLETDRCALCVLQAWTRAGAERRRVLEKEACPWRHRSAPLVLAHTQTLAHTPHQKQTWTFTRSAGTPARGVYQGKQSR